jgi:putative DNA methylase
VSQVFVKTTPSFLEAGLPCASLSAECQRDNTAKRPPQNRLHIWWARRPPTISRAAIVSALLPYDAALPEDVLGPFAEELDPGDLSSLPERLDHIRPVFERLLEVPATDISPDYNKFLRALGIRGDALRAYKRIQIIKGQGERIPVLSGWGYRHIPASRITPSRELTRFVLQEFRKTCGLSEEEPIRMLDSMAGGGVIPLEGIRFGLEVFANELNDVAAIILHATLLYPARFDGSLIPILRRVAAELCSTVHKRLAQYFPLSASTEQWEYIQSEALQRWRAKQICRVEPGGDERVRAGLWLRHVPCSRCNLNIPLASILHCASRRVTPELMLQLSHRYPN